MGGDKNTPCSEMYGVSRGGTETRSCALFSIFNSANTYAKPAPLASFHAGCDGNRSVESPEACPRISTQQSVMHSLRTYATYAERLRLLLHQNTWGFKITSAETIPTPI